MRQYANLRRPETCAYLRIAESGSQGHEYIPNLIAADLRRQQRIGQRRRTFPRVRAVAQLDCRKFNIYLPSNSPQQQVCAGGRQF